MFSLHANRLVAVVCVNLLSLGASNLSCILPAFCFMREASVTFVRKRACALSVRWRAQQHQARAVGEDKSLPLLEVHCLKQTAEPSLCSIAGVCLGIVSAGVCVREMLLAAP